jgi:hypothetical protein
MNLRLYFHVGIGESVIFVLIMGGAFTGYFVAISSGGDATSPMFKESFGSARKHPHG